MSVTASKTFADRVKIAVASQESAQRGIRTCELVLEALNDSMRNHFEQMDMDTLNRIHVAISKIEAQHRKEYKRNKGKEAAFSRIVELKSAGLEEHDRYTMLRSILGKLRN
jgi:hypothetical protein